MAGIRACVADTWQGFVQPTQLLLPSICDEVVAASCSARYSRLNSASHARSCSMQILGDNETAAAFTEAAIQRQEAVNTLMYDEASGVVESCASLQKA